MTRIKLCGLSRPEDIQAANRLLPDYIGLVFAKGSKRQVSPEQGEKLKALLRPEIQAVGVFVNEEPEEVARLLNGFLDMAQLHGDEDEEYIRRLRSLTEKPILRAFQVSGTEDLARGEKCSADFVLLDAGAGDGRVFDWSILREMKRPYFLAGGLTLQNVRNGVQALRPYGVDVSSGIETGGKKDTKKMEAFVVAVREEGTL